MSVRLRVVGYARCSTSEQATEGMTLDSQRAQIANWAALMGAELLEIVEDAGISGGKLLVDRPNGHRIAALVDARRPAVDAVVITRLDRLGRDAAEALTYLRQFSRGKVGLVSIADRIDLSTPQGRAMAAVSAVFSELERALIGERTADALAELRRQGRAYGPVPYGFDAVGGRLLPSAEERGVLRRIERLRERGHSYQAIADRLNQQGVRAKRGGTWHGMSVRSVLRTSERLAEQAVVV